MNKKGSVTLETAISFSIVLILVVSIINCMTVYRTDLLMQRSVSESCEKFSVFAPMSITASDMLYTMINAVPESEKGEFESEAAELIAGASGLISGIDSSTGYNLIEMILDGSFGRIMRDDIAAGYASRNGGSDFGGPDSIGVDYDISEDHSVIEVTVTYKVTTIVGVRTRSIYSVIPLYGDWSLLLNPEEGETETDNIWTATNFDRGDYFREEYGANMPKTFPVIDYYEDGYVGSIASIDLTSPWYLTDPDNIDVRIGREIDALAEFSGADVNIHGERYVVGGEDIVGRTLTLIIPENSSDEAVDNLAANIEYAASRGVDVNIIRDGVSSRYSSFSGTGGGDGTS